MHYEKIEGILQDIEEKQVDIAGGSVIGIVLSCLNSLIKYICNLTIGKKNYIEVEEQVKEILEQAEMLKQEALKAIDKDKEVLEEILQNYRKRREFPEKYQKANKKAVEFCMDVTQNALKTLQLSEKISQVGNRMLSSDFKICCYYAYASVESSIVNVEINLEGLEDENYKTKIKKKCREIYKEARIIKEKMC